MKRLTLYFVLSFLALTSFAQEQWDGGGYSGKTGIAGNLKYLLNDYTHEAMLDNANTWDGELNIPSEIECDGQTYTVTSIAWLAFHSCKTLTKVRIPKTVVEIWHYAEWEECKNPFDGCTSLERIEVDEANPSMCSVDGVLFNKDMTRLYCYPAGAKNETYYVPESVSWLGGDAFADNPYLLSVQMSNNVKQMSFGIFSYCKNLKSVRLSENIKYIAAGTFEKCENLKFLDIPESVKSFEESVFRWSPIDVIIIRGTFPNGLRKDTFSFMDEERTVIYCQPSEIDNFKNVFKGIVLPIESYTSGIVSPNQVKNSSTLFDLQGRCLQKEPAQSIYIRDGRKYVGS